MPAEPQSDRRLVPIGGGQPRVALVRAKGRRGVLPYHASLDTALEAAGASLVRIQPQAATYVAQRRRSASRPSASRRLIRSPRFLLDLIRSRAAYVLCTEYGPETFASALVGRALGRRVLVFQEHGGRSGQPLSKVDRTYRRLLARFVDGFVANTDVARDEIHDVLGVDRERIHRVTLLGPPARKELQRRQLELDEPRQRPLFLYVGRLIAEKNVAAFVVAARELRDRERRFEVWLVGAGDEEPELRALTYRLGLDRVIRFLGPIDYSSLGFVYAHADVFVMPTFRDYRNMSVLEAMRFGKAIIDSRADGNASDTLREGENAFLFDPAEPRELAELMTRFIDDPSLATTMGGRSALIAAEYTPERAATELLAVLSELPPRRRRARG